MPSTGTTTEALAGSIERVTFHNADSGFAVLRHFPFDLFRLRRRAMFRYCTSAPPRCAYPTFECFPVPTAEIAPPMRAGAALGPRFLGSAQGISTEHRNASRSGGLVGS